MLQNNEIRLAISNIAWTASMDEAVYALMHQYGFCGLEIAPTRIFPDNPYAMLEQASAWSQKLKLCHHFCVPSMQSIWFGRSENLFASQADRDALAEYTFRAIGFAKVCGINNLVFGCPRNRNMPEGADVADAIAFFKRISDEAQKNGCVIALEANPVMYHTNFINTTQDALNLLKTIEHPAFMLNLDLGTVIANGECLQDYVSSVHRIHHVHISEPGLKLIQPREVHRELAYMLRKGHYRGFVSIEMSRVESLSDIEGCMKYVRAIFGDET